MVTRETNRVVPRVQSSSRVGPFDWMAGSGQNDGTKIRLFALKKVCSLDCVILCLHGLSLHVNIFIYIDIHIICRLPNTIWPLLVDTDLVL